MTERPIAIFDLDGTVADARWRLPILGDRPASASREAWARFFDLAIDDEVIPSRTALVREYALNHDIYWLTGRSDRIRPLTIDWLRRHELPDGELLMRPNDDLRPAPEWKLEQLQRIAVTRTVAVLVDDDRRVVDMARDQGFPAVLAEGFSVEIDGRGAQSISSVTDTPS